MEKMCINGVEFNNFGSNNYTEGMELVSCYPMPSGMVQDVLQGKYPGVHLNPSAPCSNEFFGVFGTKEQYKEFYKRQKEAQISKQMMEELGGMDTFMHASREEFKAAREKVEHQYKDWWEVVTREEAINIAIEHGVENEVIYLMDHGYTPEQAVAEWCK